LALCPSSSSGVADRTLGRNIVGVRVLRIPAIGVTEDRIDARSELPFSVHDAERVVVLTDILLPVGPDGGHHHAIRARLIAF
jgi:hypothetical protein